MVTRRRSLQVLAAMPLLLGQGLPHAGGGAVPSALGYLPWWMAAGWRAISLRGLNRLALFDAPVQKDGGVLDREWSRRAPGLALAAKQPIDLTLTLFTHGEFNAVFGDEDRRQRLLEAALRQLEQDWISGLHLDIEGYGASAPPAVAAFRAWLRTLDERRRRLKKGLSAFFPASDSFHPYDGEAALRMDFWVAQLYDAHWPESPVTGPLVTRRAENPVAVARALARLSALGVAPQRVLLSVPLYGWEWHSETDRPASATRGRARLLTYAQTPRELMPNDRRAATVLARQHGLRRDEEHTPYYAYHDGSSWIQGWFEDLESLTRKFAAERRLGYAGLAFFTLGYDGGALVERLLDWWPRRER